MFAVKADVAAELNIYLESLVNPKNELGYFQHVCYWVVSRWSYQPYRVTTVVRSSEGMSFVPADTQYRLSEKVSNYKQFIESNNGQVEESCFSFIGAGTVAKTFRDDLNLHYHRYLNNHVKEFLLGHYANDGWLPSSSIAFEELCTHLANRFSDHSTWWRHYLCLYERGEHTEEYFSDWTLDDFVNAMVV